MRWLRDAVGGAVSQLSSYSQHPRDQLVRSDRQTSTSLCTRSRRRSRRDIHADRQITRPHPHRQLGQFAFAYVMFALRLCNSVCPLSSVSDVRTPHSEVWTWGQYFYSFAVSGPRVWNDLPPTLRSSSTTLGQFQSRQTDRRTDRQTDRIAISISLVSITVLSRDKKDRPYFVRNSESCVMFLPRDAYAYADYAVGRCLSVFLSVRHTPVLNVNGHTYPQNVFTIG